MLGEIRAAAIFGVATPKLEPMTYRELNVLRLLTWANYCEQVVLKKAQGDPNLAILVQKRVTDWRRTASMFGGPAPDWRSAISGKLLGDIAEPVLFNITQPNFDEAYVRDHNAQASEGLLQLETARRIYAIEHGAAPKSLAALTPEPLAKLPVDPFAPKGATFNLSSGGAIYSIGPDGRNDAARVAYDPTNGVVSPGDIFFNPPASRPPISK
jgi:hypothetical protein